MYIAGRVSVPINPVYIHCGQSARDNIIDFMHTFKQCSRQRTLPRGPGCRQSVGDVIGIASHFRSIIVKCQPRGVYRI